MSGESESCSPQHPGARERNRTLPGLDHDPYIVVSGGRLYWIQDAYTTSSWFPYAQRMRRPDELTSEIPSRSLSMLTMAVWI